MTQIIILNEDLSVKGSEEKFLVHEKGLFHKGFSVVLFDKFTNQLLFHRRSTSKYHSGGLWTNSCCSHYTLPECSEKEVQKRICEELGIPIHLASLKHIGNYRYYARLENRLIENEYCDVFFAPYSSTSPLTIDPKEISEASWLTIEEWAQFQNEKITTVWVSYVLSVFQKYQQSK